MHISGIDVRLIKDGVVGLLSFNEFPEEAETFILVNFWANLNSKCVIYNVAWRNSSVLYYIVLLFIFKRR